MSFTKQLDGIRAIRSLANGSLIVDGISSNDKDMTSQMIRSILSGNLEETIKSSYVQELLLYQLNNTPPVITYEWSMLMECTFLGHVLFKGSQNQMPNIFNLNMLFPRSHRIVFVMPDMFEMQSVHWDSLMDDLAQNSGVKSLSFEWESDLGDVIRGSFRSLLNAVQNNNVTPSLKPQGIELVITVPKLVPSLGRTSSISGETDKTAAKRLVLSHRAQTPRGHFCIDLCTRDLVSPLPTDSRVEWLVCGFLRELDVTKSPTALCRGCCRPKRANRLPDDVVIMCWQYTGDSNAFGIEQLTSLKESGLNCCGYATKWGKCARAVPVPLIMLSKLVVNIMSLMMGSIDDTSNMEGPLNTLSVKAWLFVGAVVDLVLMCNMSKLYYQDKEEFMKPRFKGCLELVVALFYSIWIVFGIVLMERLDKVQMTYIVSVLWCIVQGITSALLPFCLNASEKRSIIECCWTFCGNCSEKPTGIWKFAKKDPKFFCFIFCLLMIKFGGIAADIAALVIVSAYDCNNAIVVSPLGSLDINSWMFVGAITDIMVPFVSYVLVLNEQAGMQFLILSSILFEFLWSVFGFILYSNMDSGHSCSKMVLSWSIIQILWTISGICCFIAFYVLLFACASCLSRFFQGRKKLRAENQMLEEHD